MRWLLIFWKKNSTSEDELNKIETRLANISEILEGKSNFTFIIEDPLGNSAILTEKNLIVEELSDEELEKMQTGYLFSVDVKELEDK